MNARISTATTLAEGGSAYSCSAKRTVPTVSVPGPTSRIDIVSSPKAGMNTRNQPARMAGRRSGSQIVRNAVVRLAPETRAASSSVTSVC